MHTSTHARARTAAAAAALLATAVALVGCSPPAPTTPSASEPEPTPTMTTAAPTATATASATATVTPPPTSSEPEPAGELFETQNGTMRLRLPEGWTTTDLSRVSTDGRNGQVWWENMIDITSPDGLQLGYYDGYAGNAGFIRTDFGIVHEIPSAIADDIAAMSWWVHDSRYFVYAGMATHSGQGTEPIPEFVMPGVERNHSFTVLLLGESNPAVETQAEAEELLGSPEMIEALELIASVELTGVDPSAMPPGVEP